MTKVILIRHGQTKWNLTGRYQGQTDIELSNEGIEQAMQVANRLSKENIDVVYSSDLDRAYQTAKCIAGQHNLTVNTDIAFREINFGQWEGLTYEQIEETWPAEIKLIFSATSKVKIPKGESIITVAERMEKTIDTIVKNHSNKTIVIVSHGMAIRSAIAHYMHIPLDYVWKIRQDNTAINIINFYDNKAIIELINDTSHLKKH